MKEVEPLLSPELHEHVTRLLCELVAYDLMQVMHAIGERGRRPFFEGSPAE